MVKGHRWSTLFLENKSLFSSSTTRAPIKLSSTAVLRPQGPAPITTHWKTKLSQSENKQQLTNKSDRSDVTDQVRSAVVFYPIGQLCPFSDWTNQKEGRADQLLLRLPELSAGTPGTVAPLEHGFGVKLKATNWPSAASSLEYLYSHMAAYIHTYTTDIYICRIENILWCCCRPGPSGTPAEWPFGLVWPTEHWPSSSWGDIWLVGTAASQRHCGPAADVHTAGWRSAAPPCRSRLIQTHQTTPVLGILETCLPWWSMGILSPADDATDRLQPTS